MERLGGQVGRQGTAAGEQVRQRFGALLEAHRKIVFKVCHTYCRHADDRADLAQEIAAQLWRAYPGYDPERPFSTWMYRIALNVAISYVRSDGPRQRLAVPLDEDLHDLADDSADHEAAQRVRALHRVIQQLEPLNRALLLLYLEDRSYREIAEVLGISETNVATKINRLKQRIRDDLTA
ncbi:RNA polymerase sigma factor [Lysobacter silvisoli]|uniref:Sigma-70 family RNA polymerase sigma factor n=1 Tax=Lysobacter silvisoli TaxID=2293254 RepID=A0A371K1E9_9GAMM|nr:sigma-70 family RNA polymerase sigma factor [Lysobacter silvisoli]RDZ27751.1 sigma-70 family RNA polymerase sigma factor [Lysobacter silvisoli]